MPALAAPERSTFSSQVTPGGGNPSEMSTASGFVFNAAATLRATSFSPVGSIADSSIWIGLPEGGPACGTETSTLTPGNPTIALRRLARMSFALGRLRQSTNSYWITPTTSGSTALPAPEGAPARV